MPAEVPVFATDDGEVIYAGNEVRGMGHMLLIREHDGSISAYGHCEMFNVEVGERVERGEIIAHARPGALETSEDQAQRAGKDADTNLSARRLVVEAKAH